MSVELPPFVCFVCGLNIIVTMRVQWGSRVSYVLLYKIRRFIRVTSFLRCNIEADGEDRKAFFRLVA